MNDDIKDKKFIDLISDEFGRFSVRICDAMLFLPVRKKEQPTIDSRS